MTSPQAQHLPAVRKKIWDARVPLEIKLAAVDCNDYDKSESYLLLAPRISYLPLLLPRLIAFFGPSLIQPDIDPSEGWFEFESVPLKWHLPIGLLFDLYSRAKDRLVAELSGGDNGSNAEEQEELADPYPWRLTLHLSGWPEDSLVRLDKEGLVLRDAFRNGMKEASYIRHGSGKVMMSLGKEHTTQLWEAVETSDLALYAKTHQRVIHPVGESLRNVPIKLYLPAVPVDDSEGNVKAGHLQTIQGLVGPSLPSRQLQTLGTALNTFLPALFPSRRSPLLAYPVLHGAIVPLGVGLEELAEYAAYADGYLHIAIAMMG